MCMLYFFFLLRLHCGLVFFFFFQAEDGIRDVAVTGVQTCALPISGLQAHSAGPLDLLLAEQGEGPDAAADAAARARRGAAAVRVPALARAAPARGLEGEREAGLSALQAGGPRRSEERRVGKEG